MDRRASQEYNYELHMRQASDPSAGLGSPSASHTLSPPPSPRTSAPRDTVLDLGLPEEGDLERIEPIPESQRIYIEIENLSAFVPPLFGQPTLLDRLKPAAIKGRVAQGTASFRKPVLNQILHGVSGCVRPGEVLALMGPSGSGKTTMLSIMGGRAQKSMQVHGRIIFNGTRLNKNMKRRIGFVMQDDLMYESLTVNETLYYAAMLRLPRDMSKEEKLRRVDSVIAALGLEKCRDTIIGGFMRRGISGGERKRASVGHELLINPSTLFLDEPTSGLDSTTALHLLRTLRRLAQGGRAVVTTIHQPSSRLYMQLDKLMLLSEGHLQYYGHAQQAVDYFEALGFSIPPRVNAADFILDIASGEVGTNTLSGEGARMHLIACADAFLAENPLDGFDLTRDRDALAALASLTTNMDDKKGLSSDTDSPTPPGARGLGSALGRGVSKVGSGSARWVGATFRTVSSKMMRGTGVGVEGVEEEKTAAAAGMPVSKGDRWGASFSGQVAILFQRSLRTRRFQSLSTQDMWQLGAIAVLSGLFWLQKGQSDTLAAARDINSCLFFMLMFLAFRSLFVALFTFPEEQRHMLKERASGMYRLSSFYVARTLSDFPMDMALPTILVLVVYFMAGLQYNAGTFFATYGTILLCMFVAQSLGLLLGAWLMNPKTAQAVAAVLMLGFLLVAGFFVSDIPAFIAWLKYVSFVYYGYGVLVYLQYNGGERLVYSCTTVTAGSQCTQTKADYPPADPRCVPVEDLAKAFGMTQDITSSTEALRNGMILLGFLIALRVAVYFVLRSKTSGM